MAQSLKNVNIFPIVVLHNNLSICSINRKKNKASPWEQTHDRLGLGVSVPFREACTRHLREHFLSLPKTQQKKKNMIESVSLCMYENVCMGLCMLPCE